MAASRKMHHLVDSYLLVVFVFFYFAAGAYAERVFRFGLEDCAEIALGRIIGLVFAGLVYYTFRNSSSFIRFIGILLEFVFTSLVLFSLSLLFNG